MGATILSDLDFRESLISFANPSMAAILIPSSGFILICTTAGPISKPSIEIGTQNSQSFVCKDLAFSTRNLSSMFFS